MQLSDELLDKCGSLLYRSWAEAVDNLKAVKAERNDGSDDWEQFHAHRLQTAKDEEAKLDRLMKELKPHLPLTKALKR